MKSSADSRSSQNLLRADGEQWLVFLLGRFVFRLVLLFEEFLQAIDQALLAADHMQAALLLVFLENSVQTLFQIAHYYTSYKLLLLD